MAKLLDSPGKTTMAIDVVTSVPRKGTTFLTGTQLRGGYAFFHLALLYNAFSIYELIHSENRLSEGTYIYFFILQDIVVFTNNVTNCVYYQNESANVKSRFACVLPTETIQANVNNRGKKPTIPNNRSKCDVSLLLLTPVVCMCAHVFTYTCSMYLSLT